MSKNTRPLVSLFAFALLNPVSAMELVVDPTGDDANPGTHAKPLRTLQGARDAVRAIKQGGGLTEPITVWLREGQYSVEEPVVLTSEDSGTAVFPICFAAAEGETVVIDGGRRIPDWRQEGGYWVADLPSVKAGEWGFRQLFLDGVKLVRARTPNEGFFRVAGCPEGTPKTVNYHTDCQSFEFKPGDIRPDWTNINDVEVIVYHFWTDSHLPIRSIDTKTNVVTFAHKAGKVFTDDFSEDGARYIVENIFEGLDQPGEWYLNRKTGRLYLMLEPGQDPNEAEVIAPVAEALLVLRGDAEKQGFVEHLHFCNLGFRYTHFELPKGNSNDRQGSATVPAAIRMRAARYCRFENCEVANTGTYAFDLEEGCSQNLFWGNEIHHVAAGGFRLNGGTYAKHPLKRTRGNVITDNRVHHYGEDFPSAVGVLLMHTEGNTVAHNEIHHGYYTGVSLGWRWGYHRSISRDNVVESNHIHHIGQGLLSDMGAIYTLGPSPGTVLRNNLIHDIDANHYGGWGIYHDEGSSHLLVEDNIVYNTKFAGFNIHYAKEVTVRNNIFAFGRFQQLSRSCVEPHQSCFFENNIVYWRGGVLLDYNWRDKPYSFYATPRGDSGIIQMQSTFTMDWNLYFNPRKDLADLKFNGLSWPEWQKAGKDKHSLYADPMFVDAEAFDFRLRPESPAIAQGFRPIDVRRVGPRCATGLH